MSYRLNVNTADFSKYNLGPAFLSLAIVPFNLNVRTCLQNRTYLVSLMVLNHLVCL